MLFKYLSNGLKTCKAFRSVLRKLISLRLFVRYFTRAHKINGAGSFCKFKRWIFKHFPKLLLRVLKLSRALYLIFRKSILYVIFNWIISDIIFIKTSVFLDPIVIFVYFHFSRLFCFSVLQDWAIFCQLGNFLNYLVLFYSQLICQKMYLGHYMIGFCKFFEDY